MKTEPSRVASERKVMVATPVLSLRGLTKFFGATRALRNVSFDIAPGAVHALAGSNGSGKSTLIKILSGFHRADEGSRALFMGEELRISTTSAVRHPQMRFVHQATPLILTLGAMDNVALSAGYVSGRLGLGIDWRRQRRLTAKRLAEFGVSLDLDKPMEYSTPLEQSLVAIVAALVGLDDSAGDRGLLVLDEPTAALPHTEVDHLLGIVRRLRDRGLSVLYVSHRMDELFQIADRVTVLRDGELVADEPIQSMQPERLVELIAGAGTELSGAEAGAPARRQGGSPRMRVRGLAGRYLKGLSFDLDEGEILGVAGLPGSGVEEVPGAFGRMSTTLTGGEVQLPLRSADWYRVGSGRTPSFPVVPADRAGLGVISECTVAENVSISVIGRLARFGFVHRSGEQDLVRRWLDELSIKAPSPASPMTELSGGNQQKVVLARALACEPGVIVLCDPTAGVDVVTRRAIYEFVRERAAAGLSVLVTSSDIDDLTGLCSRVLVLSRGVGVAEFVGEASRTRILSAMEGHSRDYDSV